MKFFRKNELKLLWPFYLDSLLSSILYFAPIFIVVFLNDLGMSFSQIGILVAITPLFALVFEVPTGAVADLWGRKFSVLVGYSIEAVAVFSLFFVNSFYSALLGFALLGFGSTLSSGSKEAWVIDLVKDKKLSRSFFHKSQSINAFALIISGFIGVIAVKSFGLASIWMFMFVSFILSISILLFSKENYVKRKIRIRNSLKEMFVQAKTSIVFGYKHHVLYYYFIASFIFAAALSFGMSITWTATLLELNFPKYAFGYLWSAIGFIAMITPVFSHKLLKEGKEKRFIMIGLLLSAVATILILFPKTWIMVLFYLLIIDFFLDLISPAYRIYFHNFTPSKLRATLGSVDAMIVSLATIISLPVVGYLIDVIGPRYTLAIYAPLILIVVFLYSKIKEDKI